jgi:hypothetical protein
MVGGFIYWASCIYAEVHAMRVAIESWTEFKQTVHDDSKEQWVVITGNSTRLGLVEARTSGLESKAEIHDREIQLLMEKRSA